MCIKKFILLFYFVPFSAFSDWKYIGKDVNAWYFIDPVQISKRDYSRKVWVFLIQLYALKTTTIHFFIIKSMIVKMNEAGSSALLLFRALCQKALFFLLVLLRLNLLGLKLRHTQFIQTLWNLFVRSSRNWNPKIHWFNSQSRKVKTKPETSKPQHTQLILPPKFRETPCQSNRQRLFF